MGSKGKRKREEQRQIWEKAMAFVPPNGTVPREKPESEEETGAWKCGYPSRKGCGVGSDSTTLWLFVIQHEDTS